MKKTKSFHGFYEDTSLLHIIFLIVVTTDPDRFLGDILENPAVLKNFDKLCFPSWRRSERRTHIFGRHNIEIPIDSLYHFGSVEEIFRQVLFREKLENRSILG